MSDIIKRAMERAGLTYEPEPDKPDRVRVSTDGRVPPPGRAIRIKRRKRTSLDAARKWTKFFAPALGFVVLAMLTAVGSYYVSGGPAVIVPVVVGEVPLGEPFADAMEGLAR